MTRGRVLRSHSNIFYVDVAGELIACRPRGKFRLGKSGRPVCVGDWVEVTLSGAAEGRIDKVLPRQSALSRPPVANVDQALVVFTLQRPEADYLLLDRFLVHAESAGIEVRIVLNKIDLTQPEQAAAFQDQYERVGYPVHPVSALTGQGLEELSVVLTGRTSVLAGQSGVGKSALLAALNPHHQVQVGELSARQGRGRHTTRHVELVPAAGGLLVDTPGFTHLEFDDMQPPDLARLFPEFRSLLARCRFDDCLHRAEPDCAVKACLHDGGIVVHRYEHYLMFLTEIEEQRKW